MRAACHDADAIQDIDVYGYFVGVGAFSTVGATAKLPPPADFAGPFTLY
jgi:hypothetical protein